MKAENRRESVLQKNCWWKPENNEKKYKAENTEMKDK